MRATILTLTCWYFLLHSLSGQTFKLQGFAAEKNGKLLNNVTITITGTKFQKDITTSSPNGWYNCDIPIGTYDVTAEATGYQTARKTVTIKDRDIYLNFNLLQPPPPSRLDKDVLKVGIVYDPPMFWFKQKNDGTTDTLGITYELVKLLEKELNRKFELQLCGYVESPELLREGKLDLLFGGFIPSLHYPKDILWSYLFMEANYRLIVPVGSPIRSLEDLKKTDNLVIGHYDEPVVKEWISKNLPNATPSAYEASDWYKCLPDGEVDVIINEYPYAKESIKPYFKLLEFIPEPLNQQGYAICVPPKDYRLLDQVNNALQKIMKINAFKKAYKKYLDTEIPTQARTPILTGETDYRRYPTRRKYVVQTGDDLEKIARRYLGSETYWKEIWNLNFTDRKLNGLKELIVGSELRLPVDLEKN